MALEVIDAGFLSSVQDLGRSGWAKFGVPRSGAMDEFALRCANRLAGNPDAAAGIEVGPGGLKIRLSQVSVVAVCGTGFSLTLDGDPKPLWMSLSVRRGQIIELKPDGSGVWAVLAICGGVQIPAVMGSRSTYLRGGFGGHKGRALLNDDFLLSGDAATNWQDIGCRWLPPGARPVYSPSALVRVVEDAQREDFSPDTREQFYRQEYVVQPASDRIGYRLVGAALSHGRAGEMLSAGMLPGTIQVPADQQPIVMLADCPTSGGYPRIATVIRADLGLLAQCVPGSGQIRFQPVEVAQAQRAYREMVERLERIEPMDEEEIDAHWAGATR